VKVPWHPRFVTLPVPAGLAELPVPVEAAPQTPAAVGTIHASESADAAPLVPSLPRAKDAGPFIESVETSTVLTATPRNSGDSALAEPPLGELIELPTPEEFTPLFEAPAAAATVEREATLSVHPCLPRLTARIAPAEPVSPELAELPAPAEASPLSTSLAGTAGVDSDQAARQLPSLPRLAIGPAPVEPVSAESVELPAPVEAAPVSAALAGTTGVGRVDTAGLPPSLPRLVVEVKPAAPVSGEMAELPPPAPALSENSLRPAPIPILLLIQRQNE